MGRALFSLAYAAPEPAVRIEPEPEFEPYGRWSDWNRFDPDSDEFFQDAEYEAFIDPVHMHPQRTSSVATLETVSDSERGAESSDSGHSSDGDQGSPVMPRSEIPVVLGGRLYNNRPLSRSSDTHMEWMERSSSPASYVSSSTSLLPVHSPDSLQSSDLLENPPFIPPPSFRQPTPDIERESRHRIDPPPSPALRRTVNIIPINVSRIQIMPATRSPSPASPLVPATPPSQTTPFSLHSQAMITPSPPPSVTPRFYSWQNHPIPALPTTPTIIRANIHSTLIRRENTPTRIYNPSAIV